MAGPRTVFICQECGCTSVRWLGKCPECEQWNTFLTRDDPRETAPGPAVSRSGVGVQSLGEIGAQGESRLPTGVGELDRVLGGGIVLGSVLLIGGEPGVGKSTLLLQVLARLVDAGRRVLYISAEESPLQIKLRAERLGVVRDGLFLLVESCLETILAEIRQRRPEVVVVDSVQAVFSAAVPSPPGTIVQVREVAGRLISLAKGEGISTILVGHVTKDGSLAGPKVLEHMVDTVISFESDAGHLYRLVRAGKNRYGSTSEVGIFQMGDRGLVEVDNPSGIFLGLHREPQSGTVVVPSLEGRRPLLVEVQALVSATGSAAGRRSVSGLDLNRVIMLLAVLEKRVGLIFASTDVYVNASGGFRLVEPAADLPILLALASSHRNLPLPAGTAAFGEVSLTGEVRGVSGVETRLRGLAKLGFRRCLLPESAREALESRPPGLELVFLDGVDQAVAFVNG